MMNNYLFETCRGQINLNKLLSKSVHFVCSFHIAGVSLQKFLARFSNSVGRFRGLSCKELNHEKKP
jgi:hypothetical protein